MGQPKPKIKWSCDPTVHDDMLHFRATLMWYGIEIKTEAKLCKTRLYEDPWVYLSVIQAMQDAIDDALDNVTRTITDSLDYDDEKTEAET
uniref:Uncharacterized protein n=1 Tax=Pseudomonas phage HRDY3 TaxID=3236930 RepID=A0AB39CDU7_9VIRU